MCMFYLLLLFAMHPLDIMQNVEICTMYSVQPICLSACNSRCAKAESGLNIHVHMM